jgi:hypothetical protein
LEGVTYGGASFFLAESRLDTSRNENSRFVYEFSFQKLWSISFFAQPGSPRVTTRQPVDRVRFYTKDLKK